MNENPNEVSLLCIGPLTNIALALNLDSTIATKVHEVYIMGGTLLGKGNMTKNTEFNFAIDPHAARIVFKSFPLINLIPWEPC